MPGNRNVKNVQEHIIISPIGHFDPHLIRQVVQEVHRITGYDALAASVLQDVDFAFEPSRDQHCSTPILEKLADAAPPGAVKILAICSVDLFIPILTFVYGEAQLGGKACIISTHRLSEGLGTARSDIFIRRVVKEAIHELGHTFNLRHCKDHNCCMHYCRTIKDVDRKTHHLCRYCKVLLEDEMKSMSKI